ncbi:MAG: shikimate dehydrogenase [Deltaproteobacteria bacterium]|nr:shikimate dehydrogenase [Deltaproteobacteria bacterium]
MLKLGLIGSGISRTQVHKLHGLMGELSGLKVQYDLFDEPNPKEFDLLAKLHWCKQNGYTGVNVTHPFKLQAFLLLDDTSQFPDGLVSVNTILLNAQGMRGYNTDHSGFIEAYRAHFGDRKPGPVMMMGAGGVGVAIGFGLARLGADSIAICDTQRERAEELATRLQLVGAKTRVVPHEPEELFRCASQSDGLINATPIGMNQYPGNPFPEPCFSGRRWAFEAIYTPPNTEFVLSARRHAMSIIGGFELFLHQGIDAFEHFSGIRIDRAHIVATYKARFPQPI